MYAKNAMKLLGLLILGSMVLAACQPAVTSGTEETPAPEPKTLVVCMAQEPQSLYALSGSALVQSAVYEALYDWGVDTRSYSYQPVGIVKLPSLDDGDAVMTEVDVTIGDTVYNAATDEVLVIAADSVVSLTQTDGSMVEVNFAETPTAKTVQISTTWTLVDGLTWEDGTPVTTADIVFTRTVAASPDTASIKYTIERTESFTAVDDKSWNMVTIPGFTSGTYYSDGVYLPLPSHIYGEGGSNPLTPAEMLQDEDINRDPLAFGPFKLEEWVAGDHILLVKNPTYYRASEGLPKIDRLVYRFIPDTNQLIAQLAAGECDIGTQDAAFEPILPLIRMFEAEGMLIPQIVSGTSFEHLDFNATPVDTYTGFANTVKNDDGTPIFANPEIRQAIAHCIDRQAVIDAATNGAGIAQNTYAAPDHPLYVGDENVTIYELDPAKGLEMLANNGWTDSDGDGVLDKNGVKLSFVYSTRTNAMRQLVTQVVQNQLKENCMIETEIEYFGGEFFNDGPDGLIFGRQYDMGEFAWLTGVEPPCNLYQAIQLPNEVNGWGAANDVGFINAEFDNACATALNTLDSTIKASEHARAQQIFAQYLPSIILFTRGKILVTRPEVVGVIMDPTANSEMWNVENFDLNIP